MEDGPYQFRPATAHDTPLLAGWQRQPHVARWWEASDYEANDLEPDPRVSLWIVELDGRPFGFMQDYDVHGWGADHHFAYLPQGSRGIDQYIGEPDMIGKGHGPKFMRQRIDALFRAGVPVIGTDPHPDNARAIKVYSGLGFVQTSGPTETPWGRVVRMELKNPGAAT